MYGIIPLPATRRCPRCHKKYTTLVYGEWIKDTICDACRTKDQELLELRKKLHQHREPTEHLNPGWKI